MDSSELVDEVPEDAVVVVDTPVLPVLVVVDEVVSDVAEEVDGAAVVATGAVVAGNVVVGAGVAGAVVADVAVSEVEDVADEIVSVVGALVAVGTPVLPELVSVAEFPVVGLLVISIHVPDDVARAVSDEPEHGASALFVVAPQVPDVVSVEAPVAPVDVPHVPVVSEDPEHGVSLAAPHVPVESPPAAVTVPVCSVVPVASQVPVVSVLVVSVPLVCCVVPVAVLVPAALPEMP